MAHAAKTAGQERGHSPASGVDAQRVLLNAAERIAPVGAWVRGHTAQRPPQKPTDPWETCLGSDPKAEKWGVGGAIYAQRHTEGVAACHRAFEHLRETICGGSVFLWNGDPACTQDKAIAALREAASTAGGNQ